MKRVRSGQPERSTLLVSSATWARFDGSPSPPRAGCHVSRSKRLWSMAVVTPSFERAVMKNSMLRCRQACAICVEQPAASTRSCTRRGAGAPPLGSVLATASGSCATAASSTVRDVVGRGVAGPQHDRQRLAV